MPVRHSGRGFRDRRDGSLRRSEPVGSRGGEGPSPNTATRARPASAPPLCIVRRDADGSPRSGEPTGPNPPPSEREGAPASLSILEMSDVPTSDVSRRMWSPANPKPFLISRRPKLNTVLRIHHRCGFVAIDKQCRRR